MALDESLLLSEGSPATLRTYRWFPAGLSLGYFQDSGPFRDIQGDHVLVRRITGGGAILHQDEITFSLSANAELLPSPVGKSYELIHDAIRAALQDVGVETRRPHDAESVGRPRPDNPWCFADPLDIDLVTPVGRKILGSAQRRLNRPRSRVLHQGSLVLRAPRMTPTCGGVSDQIAPEIVESALEAALVARIGSALGLRPQVGSLQTSEVERAQELADTRYALSTFTFRR